MNKIVLVTGATSGYGLATAKKFKENGDIVIIASRNPEKVKNTVSEYGFSDGFSIDVTDFSKWHELCEFIMEKYGRIDVLVNNAGGGVCIADVTDQAKEDIDTAISLNLNSVIYGSKIFGSVMKKQKSGTIVNISSVCANHSWNGWAIYSAAKAGIVSFTKCLYLELQPFGVRATTIIPGSASTGFQKNAGLGETKDSLMPEDIANAVYFASTLPNGAFVEEMTVWGTSQVVNPL